MAKKTKNRMFEIKMIVEAPMDDSEIVNETVLQAVLDTGCKVQFMSLGSSFTNDLLTEYWGHEIQQMIIPTDEEK